MGSFLRQKSLGPLQLVLQFLLLLFYRVLSCEQGEGRPCPAKCTATVCSQRFPAALRPKWLVGPLAQAQLVLLRLLRRGPDLCWSRRPGNNAHAAKCPDP